MARIDVNGLAGDRAANRRAQIEDHPGDLFRLLECAEEVSPYVLLSHLVRANAGSGGMPFDRTPDAIPVDDLRQD